MFFWFLNNVKPKFFSKPLSSLAITFLSHTWITCTKDHVINETNRALSRFKCDAKTEKSDIF